MLKIRFTAVAGVGVASLALLMASATSSAAQQTISSAKSLAPSHIDKSKMMSAADRAAIDAAGNAFLKNSIDASPGLWLAVWDPTKGYYEHAYGNAILPNTAATVNDHFRIGSITKTVWATAVLQQVAKGKLELTDTVKKLDPELAKKFPSIGKYTVGQLLSMKTQIPDYADAAVAIEVGDPQHRFTRNDLISLGLTKGKKLTKAGGYSTTNYIILGVILEKLTGKAPETLVNGVFKQAGMTQSMLQTKNAPMPNPVAHGYVGELAAKDFQAIDPKITATTDVSSWALEWGKEGGGAYSTIGDLATWGSTCLGTSLLPKPIAAKRLVFSMIDAGNYGRGIIRQGAWLSHEGQVIGNEANVSCNPITGAVTAWAVNSTYGSFMLNDVLGPVAYPDYYAATQKK